MAPASRARACTRAREIIEEFRTVKNRFRYPTPARPFCTPKRSKSARQMRTKSKLAKIVFHHHLWLGKAREHSPRRVSCSAPTSRPLVSSLKVPSAQMKMTSRRHKRPARHMPGARRRPTRSVLATELIPGIAVRPRLSTRSVWRRIATLRVRHAVSNQFVMFGADGVRSSPQWNQAEILQ